LLLASSFSLVYRAAQAQHVVSVSGERVVLSAGCEAGVSKGMTGKFCVPESVGGRTVENCFALFRIASVSADQSVARITKGGRDLHAGVQARFDGKLSGTCPKPPPPPSTSVLAARALKEADRAFDDRDYRGALERYENYLRIFPQEDGADKAAERKEVCQSKLAVPVVSSTVPANGTYGAGKTLDYTVTFNVPVIVKGTPFVPLSLNTGGQVKALYLSGSGSATLLFQYPVATGNADADGVTTGATISLNGGTIKDIVGINAQTSVPFASTAGVLVDTISPIVLNAAALATKAEELFGAGKLAEARDAAVEALKLDATNTRAQSMLASIRAKSVSRFNALTDVAVSSDGIGYVADSGNNTIRRIADSATTTIAGAAGQYGSVDGHADRARFNDPTGVAVAADGSIYVADQYNATVRRLSLDGTVTTIAGRSGLTGVTEGVAAAARLSAPRRLAVAADGSVYIADAGNHAIRRISADRVVDTIATVNAPDRMDPAAVAIDSAGNVLIADSWSHVVRRIGSDHRVSVLAGVPGSSGSADGPVGNARFNAPEGIAVDRNGNVYVSDSGNHTIRKIANGKVTTVAGGAGLPGAIDGPGTNSRLNHPAGIAFDAQGRLWVADSGNHTVRVLTDGFLMTVAGRATVIGSADGAN
jgi:sugar lactone lactonase YvrE